MSVLIGRLIIVVRGRMRSYDEELCVLNRRAKWRRFNNFGEPGKVMYLPFIRQRIYAGEEVPRCLVVADDDIVAKHVSEWEKRRNPDKAQFDVKEPDRRKFEEEEQARKASSCGKSSHLVASASHVTLMIS